MSADNQAQIDFWNADGGQRWTEEQEQLDALIEAFGAAALRAGAPAPGEKVIDIGCGCGATALALAAAVGGAGEVLGVDVSAPMLARARERALGRANVRFERADASTAALPPARDLLFSRFGVMFFADPIAAFTHMRGALRPGGRLAFVCWRMFAENPWALVPAMAGLKALGVTPPAPDPHAPGPFAFGDGVRVRAILAEAGFADIAIDAFDAPMRMGANVARAAVMSTRVGPLAGALREAGGAGLDRVLAAVETAFAPYITPEGVILNGATWIVTARRG